MTKKQLMFVVALCVGLGVAYFATNENQVRVGVKTFESFAFDASKVTRIRFASKEVGIEIEKRSSGYFVRSLPKKIEFEASIKAVQSMLDAASKIDSNIFVSEQPQLHGQFRVNDESGIRVTFFVDEKIAWDLIIGDHAKEGGRFIRRPQSDAVFLSKADFWKFALDDVNNFRRRNIFELREQDVHALRLQTNNGQGIGFVRMEEEKWSFDKETSKAFAKIKFSSQRAKEFIEAVVNLKASNFPEGEKELKWANELLSNATTFLTITDSSGEEMKLRIAKDGKGEKAFVMVEGKKDVVQISQFDYRQLTPKAEEFDENAVVNSDANAMDLKSLPPNIKKQLLEAMRKQQN